MLRTMEVLKIISCLMSYPTTQWFVERDALVKVVEQSDELADHQRTLLLGLLRYLNERPLLDAQSDYDELFERGRSLSLYLFEHTFGESRDRGQAMVDLQANYREAGLDIGVRELPDYIPLFLEFVATQPADLGKGWLQDMAAVFAVLALRLDERDSPYAGLFHTLVELSELETVDLEGLRKQLSGEERDDTFEALDKVWEEEMVTFGPGSQQGTACDTAINRPTPAQSRQADTAINWMDAAPGRAPQGETL